MLTVKIVELGRAIEEFVFEGNEVTVSKVLEAAERDTANGVKINGNDVNDTTYVADGDVIFLTKKVKGNTDFVEVKFVTLGSAGGIKTIAVEPGTSISAAAEQAGVSVEGFELKVNGSTQSSEASDSLNADARIFLTKKVKGNNDFVEVKFVTLGSAGGIKTIAVEPGTSIESAAEQAGVSVEGFELKVNGSTQSSDAGDSLNADARIFLTKKVKGNN